MKQLHSPAAQGLLLAFGLFFAASVQHTSQTWLVQQVVSSEWERTSPATGPTVTPSTAEPATRRPPNLSGYTVRLTAAQLGGLMGALLPGVPALIAVLQGGLWSQGAPRRSHAFLGTVLASSFLLSARAPFLLPAPVLLLAKACRILPTLLLGTVWLRKRYSRVDWAAAVLTAAGLALCLLPDALLAEWAHSTALGLGFTRGGARRGIDWTVPPPFQDMTFASLSPAPATTELLLASSLLAPQGARMMANGTVFTEEGGAGGSGGAIASLAAATGSALPTVTATALAQAHGAAASALAPAASGAGHGVSVHSSPSALPSHPPSSAAPHYTVAEAAIGALGETEAVGTLHHPAALSPSPLLLHHPHHVHHVQGGGAEHLMFSPQPLPMVHAFGLHRGGKAHGAGEGGAVTLAQVCLVAVMLFLDGLAVLVQERLLQQYRGMPRSELMAQSYGGAALMAVVYAYTQASSPAASSAASSGPGGAAGLTLGLPACAALLSFALASYACTQCILRLVGAWGASSTMFVSTVCKAVLVLSGSLRSGVPLSTGQQLGLLLVLASVALAALASASPPAPAASLLAPAARSSEGAARGEALAEEEAGEGKPGWRPVVSAFAAPTSAHSSPSKGQGEGEEDQDSEEPSLSPARAEAAAAAVQAGAVPEPVTAPKRRPAHSSSAASAFFSPAVHVGVHARGGAGADVQQQGEAVEVKPRAASGSGGGAGGLLPTLSRALSEPLLRLTGLSSSVLPPSPGMSVGSPLLPLPSSPGSSRPSSTLTEEASASPALPPTPMAGSPLPSPPLLARSSTGAASLPTGSPVHGLGLGGGPMGTTSRLTLLRTGSSRALTAVTRHLMGIDRPAPAQETLSPVRRAPSHAAGALGVSPGTPGAPHAGPAADATPPRPGAAAASPLGQAGGEQGRAADRAR